jgi:hypothetical protein
VNVLITFYGPHGEILALEESPAFVPFRGQGGPGSREPGGVPKEPRALPSAPTKPTDQVLAPAAAEVVVDDNVGAVL